MNIDPQAVGNTTSQRNIRVLLGHNYFWGVVVAAAAVAAAADSCVLWNIDCSCEQDNFGVWYSCQG